MEKRERVGGEIRLQRRLKLRKKMSSKLCLRKPWEIIKSRKKYKMNRKSNQRRKRLKRRRSKIKINLRRKRSGDYTLSVQMLILHHNKVRIIPI